jgi:hypothetical protein
VTVETEVVAQAAVVAVVPDWAVLYLLAAVRSPQRQASDTSVDL